MGDGVVISRHANPADVRVLLAYGHGRATAMLIALDASRNDAYARAWLFREMSKGGG